MISKTARWYKTLSYILRRYRICHCADQAAALTLDTLLSLVPLLATSIALLTLIPSLQHFVIQAEEKILAQFIFDTGHNVRNYLQQFTKEAATVSIIGAAVLLITTIKMLYTLNQAFETMLLARIRQKTYAEIAVSCIAWILAPLLVGLGIAVSSYIISLPFLAQYSKHLSLLRPLLIFIPIVLNTLAFSFLYMIAPLFIVPIRNTIYGAFCAAILFELSKWLFSLYLVYFPSYQALYGSLAAIPLFILWLYLSWQIALLGAIIAQALSFKDRYRSSNKLDGFIHVICWLGHLWQAQTQQQTLTMNDLIKKDNVSYAVEPEIMLEKLIELNFVTVTKQGEYRLAQNINEYSLYDCLNLFPWKLSRIESLEQLNFSWRDQLLPLLYEYTNCQRKALDMLLITVYKLEKIA